jgi:DNA-binding NarL/FixJ family response regulator
MTASASPISDRTSTITVVLADDHMLVRDGMQLMLRAVPDIDVIGEAGDGPRAVELVRTLHPHVLVLDLSMPRGDGMSALRAIAALSLPVRILVVTMHSEQESGVLALKAGAHGFLHKDAASRELVEAIREVAGGHVYVRAERRGADGAGGSDQGLSPARERFAILSKREQTVVRMVAEGFSGVEIAAHLGISTKTVDAYKHRAQAKLGIAHRTEYVQFALHAGLLLALSEN